MSNALDHVRNNCGIAGEEVVDMVYELERQLAECKRKSEMDYAVMAGDNALITGLKNDLATVTKMLDGLAEIVMDEYPEDDDRYKIAALAKLGAGKGE